DSVEVRKSPHGLVWIRQVIDGYNLALTRQPDLPRCGVRNNGTRTRPGRQLKSERRDLVEQRPFLGFQSDGGTKPEGPKRTELHRNIRGAFAHGSDYLRLFVSDDDFDFGWK